jgi:hypothetical protein
MRLMATWQDVQRVASRLPEVTEEPPEKRTVGWRVRGKTFVWERPLRKRDLLELGDTAPDGPILGAYVPDEHAKRALIAERPDVYFTTSHFDGYPVVLARLERLPLDELEELAGESWLVRAPKTLAKKYAPEAREPVTRGNALRAARVPRRPTSG